MTTTHSLRTRLLWLVLLAIALASAVQAGFGGRPELVLAALKEGPKAIVASAVRISPAIWLPRT